MGLGTRFARLNPFRLARAADAVDGLHAFTAQAKRAQKRMAARLDAIDARLETLERRLEATTKQLEILPRMQLRLGQVMDAYKTDIRHAARIPVLGDLLDASVVRAHVTAAVMAAPLETDPCPHLVVDGLLPDAVYDELVAAMPGPIFFKKEDVSRQEMQVPFVFAPAYGHAVWDFFFDEVVTGALLTALVQKFGPALDAFVRTQWPSFRSLADAGVELGVTNSRLMLRKPGYVIKPHRDPRWAFLTALVYLQQPGSLHAYGTQLYRMVNERESPHSSPYWVDDHECELVKDVPAARNRMLTFLNSTGAHGASVPPHAPEDLERYLYQVQMGPDAPTRQRLIDDLPVDRRPGWAHSRGGNG